MPAAVVLLPLLPGATRCACCGHVDTPAQRAASGCSSLIAAPKCAVERPVLVDGAVRVAVARIILASTVGAFASFSALAWLFGVQPAG